MNQNEIILLSKTKNYKRIARPEVLNNALARDLSKKKKSPKMNLDDY